MNPSECKDANFLRDVLCLRATQALSTGLSSAQRAASALRQSSVLSNAEREAQCVQSLETFKSTTSFRAPPDNPSRAELNARADYSRRKRRYDASVAVNSDHVARVIRIFRRGDAPVTVRDKERCVSICAWSFAFIIMFVALCFLFADFFDSRANPALTARLVDTPALDLPTVTFCLAVPSLPAFETFPRKGYNGSALFGARLFLNRLTGKELFWPVTHVNAVRSVTLGPPEKCVPELEAFSFAKIEKAMSDRSRKENECHSCFQVASEPRILIPKANFTKRPRGVIQLEFSLAREVAFCLVPRTATTEYLRRNLMDSVKQHSKQLQARGVLRLNGTNDLDFALDNAFNQLRRAEGLQYQTEVGSFLCNIYFASGYFYPKPVDTEIAYQYDIETDFWTPVGKGPYHRVNPPNSDRAEHGIAEDLEHIDHQVSIVSNLLVFANAHRRRVPDYTDSIGVLSEMRKTTFLFAKSLDDKKVGYSTHRRTGSQFLHIVHERFQVFTTALDFMHFGVDVVSRQPSMSVMELITNIFEYAGLCTGVCVYSVLVGPARFYLRRNNARRGSGAHAEGS